MMNFKPGVTSIATGTKLSKDDNGSNVDPMLYKRLVGSPMYLIATRLDIMFAVSLFSIFMESLKNTYWKVGKRILIYIVEITNFGIQYT